MKKYTKDRQKKGKEDARSFGLSVRCCRTEAAVSQICGTLGLDWLMAYGSLPGSLFFRVTSRSSSLTFLTQSARNAFG